MDGVVKNVFYYSASLAAGLNAATYDYSIGSLSAGTHTVKIVVDSGLEITESNEGDNSYTKTITVSNPSQPNLVPYQLSGWSDTIVVSRTTGTTTDSTGLTTADTLYVDWDVANIGTAATGSGFHNTLYVDGAVKNVFYYSASLAAGLNAATYDYSIGSLSAGTHTVKIVVDSGLEITESNEGDNSYTKTINVGSSQGLSVSASLSSLTATPSSAAADGQSIITAKVTLRDGNNNPVPGKIVQIHSGGSVAILQPASPTDANGQATATITATAPVSISIWAVDTADSVVVQQQPTIQFTSAFVSLDPAVSQAVSQLANSSSDLLVNSFASIATDEGNTGDYFHNQITQDKAKAAATAFSATIGIILPFVLPDSKDLLFVAAQSLDQDIVSSKIGDILGVIAGSSSGLSKVGQVIINRNASYQQGLQQQEQSLLAGAPPTSANFTTAYVNDLTLRSQGNAFLHETLLSQNNFLIDIQQKSSVGQADLLGPLFMTVNVAGAVAGTAFATPVGGYALAEGLNTGELLLTAPLNQQQLAGDQQSYMTAISSLSGCSYYSGLVYANTVSGFSTIAQGKAPASITGSILGVNSQIDVQSLTGITGDITTWLSQQFLNATPVVIIGEYSIMTLENTSSQPAFFSISALYTHTTTINLDNLGITHYSMTVPMIVSTTTNLDANQTAQVTIYYGNDKNGALPDPGSAIVINALGFDKNQGIYGVATTSTSLQWPTSVQNGIQSGAEPLGAKPLGGPVSTNIFGFENPIKSFVFQNQSNQTYQAQIWIANPFAIPLQATVTQPLPSGIVVLGTDGVLHGSSIVWSNTVPTNGLVEETLAFSLAVMPGAQTNLPAPTLVFTDATGTNGLSVSGFVANFSGVFPIQITGYAPTGVAGLNASMPVGATNMTDVNQSGTLTISLADVTGTVLTNYVQAFVLAGNGSTNLNFILPGTLPPGSYSITGSLNMNGGSGQVLAGAYVVSLAPLTLGLGSTTPLGTNGFNLMLQGTLGSNYVIEVSTDLFNWTPVMDFTFTNSPFYFNDPAATNSGRQFYRAVMP